MDEAGYPQPISWEIKPLPQPISIMRVPQADLGQGGREEEGVLGWLADGFINYHRERGLEKA